MACWRVALPRLYALLPFEPLATWEVLWARAHTPRRRGAKRLLLRTALAAHPFADILCPTFHAGFGMSAKRRFKRHRLFAACLHKTLGVRFSHALAVLDAEHGVRMACTCSNKHALFATPEAALPPRPWMEPLMRMCRAMPPQGAPWWKLHCASSSSGSSSSGGGSACNAVTGCTHQIARFDVGGGASMTASQLLLQEDEDEGDGDEDEDEDAAAAAAVMA